MGGDLPCVLLVGSANLLLGNKPVQAAPKQMALIARIYAAPQRCVSREDLGRLLWPHSSPASARHSVSQALYVVKRRLPELLRPEAEQICAGYAYCDIVDFREAVAKSNWLQASDLYRGPFLEGLNVSGSVHYAHWIDAVRESLSTLADRVVQGLLRSFRWEPLERLTGVLIRQGRYDAKVVGARVTALYYTQGEGAAASFIKTLSAEFAAEARDSLGALISCGDCTVPTTHPFVGRTRSLQQLSDLFEAGRRDRPSIALITGEPGIGKTALANRYYRLMALKGARVLLATAHAAEKNVPLGIAEQWLRDISQGDVTRLSSKPWMAVIRHVFPAMRGDSESDPVAAVGDISHHRLVESLRHLFIELAKDRELVLGIDDLHHADPASLGLLHYILRRCPTGLAVVVGTVPIERDPDPYGLTEWELAEIVPLKGLTVDEIEVWLHNIGVAESELKKGARSLHRSTAGNPLLVSALLDEGHALGPSQTPPQSIIDFYRPRILGRSQSAHRLLAAISLVGEPSAANTLCRIAGLTDSEFGAACKELQEFNWISIESDKLVLRHGLLGQVAISLLSSYEEKSLHGRTARVLAEGGKLPDALVAISYDLAGNSQDAFEASRSAAKACDVLHARSEKMFFLKMALSNAPSQVDEAEVRIELGQLYSQQKRFQDALDILDSEAISGASRDARKRAEVARLRVLAEMTGDSGALQDLWSRLRAVGTELPVLAATSAYTEIVGVAYDLGLDEVAAEIAEQIADDVSKVPLTVSTAFHLLRPIAVSGLLKGYDAALRRLDELPSPDHTSPAYRTAFLATKGTILTASGSLREAEELFAISLGLTERFALFDSFYTINNNLGVCLMEQGRYEEAHRHFDTAIEYAKADVSPSHHSTARDNLTILAYEQSLVSEGYHPKISWSVTDQVPGIRSVMNLHAIVGLCSLKRGELGRCKEAEREIRILLQKHGQFSNDMSYVHTFMARMAALRGEKGTGLDILKHAANHYRGRNLLVSIRLDLERCQMLLRDGQDCRIRIQRIIDELKPTGATPLAARAQALLERATHRFS